MLTLQEDLKKNTAMSDNSTSPSEFSMHERTAYLLFFIHAFQSLEDTVVRKCCLRLSSLWIWRGLSASALEAQLKQFPELKPRWKTEQTRG